MKFTLDGNFISTEHKTKKKYSLNERFAVDDSKIYFSKPNIDKKTSLAVIDLNKPKDNNYKEFGAFTDFGQSYKNKIQNKRDVFITDDYIITVPESIPVIEKYDKNSLELIETYDLLTIPIIAEALETTLNHPDIADPITTYSIARDAYLHNGILYIMLPTPTIKMKDGHKEYTGIIAFDIKDNIKYLHRYPFNEDMNIFCVTDEYIFTAPLTGGVIKRFPLNPEQ